MLAVNCLRNASNIHAIIPWCDILTNGKARRLQGANDSFLSLLKSTGSEGLSWTLYVSVSMVITQFCFVFICFFHLSGHFASLGLNVVRETFTFNQEYNLGLISNLASLQCFWWEASDGWCQTETLLVKLSTGRWKRSIWWLHGGGICRHLQEEHTTEASQSAESSDTCQIQNRQVFSVILAGQASAKLIPLRMMNEYVCPRRSVATKLTREWGWCESITICTRAHSAIKSD